MKGSGLQAANAMFERAIEVAVIAHADQVDKSGEAYILHLLRVMLDVREKGGTVEQQAAAVLHDVIEDCDVPDAFLEERFPAQVCELVDALTHQDGEDYELPEARLNDARRSLIKQADIEDNYGRMHILNDLDTRASPIRYMEPGGGARRLKTRLCPHRFEAQFVRQLSRHALHITIGEVQY